MTELVERGLYTLAGDLFIVTQLDNGTWALYTREDWDAYGEWTYLVDSTDGCITGSGYYADELLYQGFTADEQEQDADKPA